MGPATRRAAAHRHTKPHGNGRRLRRCRSRTRRGRVHQEHDRGDQQAGAIDGDQRRRCRADHGVGASLQRSAVAGEGSHGAHRCDTRRPARSRRPRLSAWPAMPGVWRCWSCRVRRTSPASFLRFTILRDGCMRPAGESSSTPPSWRRTGRSTCAPMTIPSTSTSWRCRPTSCTPRSGAARSSGVGTRFGAMPDHRGGGTVDAVTLDDVALGRSATPGGGGNSQPARSRGLRRRGLHVGRDRLGEHRRSRADHDPPHAHRAGRDPRTSSPRARRRVGRSESSRSRSTESRTGWSPRSSATSTASACGAAASAPIRTSPICSVSRATAASEWAQRARNGDRRDLPGMVRISLGFYNDHADVGRLLDALRTDRRRRLRRKVPARTVTGDYHPVTRAAPDLLAKIA